METYRETLKRRQLQEQKDLAQRLLCEGVARQAAELLKQEFGSRQVAVFGSLVHGQCSKTSDIDLAAWGLEPETYFVAVARLQDLSPLKIDLVAME